MESNEQDSLGIAIEYLLAKERFKEAWKKEHGISNLKKILNEACSQVGEGVHRDGYDIFVEKKGRYVMTEKESKQYTRIVEERLSIRKSTNKQ